ncbi:hypothetical protein IJM16_02725 [Candidatus Saccharibacteria bacterium]|nr:hypothetical protein [Candidatus Saccharibacteria bacterium]
MDRDSFNKYLGNNGFLRGGVKEACAKIYVFTRYATPIGNVIYQNETTVTTQEFLEAVAVLLAHCSQEQGDSIPQRWYCQKDDCVHGRNPFCKGAGSASSLAEKCCPHYCTEDK